MREQPTPPWEITRRRSGLFNTFRENLTYSGEKYEMAVFTGFGRLQSFHIGILRAGMLF